MGDDLDHNSGEHLQRHDSQGDKCHMFSNIFNQWILLQKKNNTYNQCHCQKGSNGGCDILDLFLCSF